MAKSLNGSDLVGYIKQRQIGEVRSLLANGVKPRLAIIRTNPDPVVDSYMKLKQGYGEDIGVAVDVCTVEQKDALETIAKLNNDKTIHGIIVQIPLPDRTQTDEVLNAVSPEKDVDGLAEGTKFDPATPLAISWLLAGYNVELKGKKIVIVGHGRLVGKPLAKMWQDSGLDVIVADIKTSDLGKTTVTGDIIVTATGHPGLIKSNMVKTDAVIVDAGVATDKNGLIGDVAPEVRELPNVVITPEKGGVGPLTVSALFENVILSAKNTI